MLTAKLLKMQSLSDDDDFMSSVGTTITDQRDKDIGDSRPVWMRTLHSTALEWKKIIPPLLEVLRRTAENIKDPLFRFFEREITSGSNLLKTVQTDLNNIIMVCETKMKQTNYLRNLISDLAKGIIPRSWKRYTVPAGLTVLQWVVDFGERIKQLQTISKQVLSEGSHVLKTVNVWLGGLFTPEAYITATRQFVAQANSWSLEELYLDVYVDFKGKLDDCSFGVTGLRLQGAQCKENRLSITATIVNDLPLTKLQWIRVNTSEMYKKSQGKVTLPVYLNQTRTELLFTLDFEAEGITAAGDHSYYERGVAIVSSSL
jgi:dynein heavy chain 1